MGEENKPVGVEDIVQAPTSMVLNKAPVVVFQFTATNWPAVPDGGDSAIPGSRTASVKVVVAVSPMGEPVSVSV
jgi:hypothetical protein